MEVRSRTCGCIDFRFLLIAYLLSSYLYFSVCLNSLEHK